MAHVILYAPISDEATVTVDRDLDQLRLTIGKWTVELFGGTLIVRPEYAAMNEGLDVLKVEA